MTRFDDHRALWRWERELRDDRGVSDALGAFEQRGRSAGSHRHHVVTLLAVVTAAALVASGTAASVLGVVVLVIAGLAVVDAHWGQRRPRRIQQMQRPT